MRKLKKLSVLLTCMLLIVSMVSCNTFAYADFAVAPKDVTTENNDSAGDTSEESTEEPTAEPTVTPVPTEEVTETPAGSEEPTATPVPTEEATETPAGSEEPTATPAPTPEINIVTSDVTYNGSEQTIATVTVVNAAEGTEVTAPGAQVTGGNGRWTVEATNAGTYNISVSSGDVSSSATAEIAKKKVTVKAANESMTYGDTVPTLTATVDGADDVVYTLGTLATSASDVGEYDITVTVVGEYPNYDVENVDGTLTIGKRDATITAQAVNKAYGDELPELTAKVDGAVNGDELKYTVTTDADRFSETGTYDITIDIDPNVHPNCNYNVTTTGAKLTIVSWRGVSITPDAVGPLTYGDALPALTATVAGMPPHGRQLDYTVVCVDANGQEVSGVLPAGQYTLKVVLNNNPNYQNVTTNKITLMVTPRPVTLTVDDASRIYGDENPDFTAQLTSGSLVGDDELDYNFETVADVTTGVGEYEVKLVLGENPNYAVMPVSGKLTITQRPVTIAVNNVADRYYGDENPAVSATITYTGDASKPAEVNGDTLDYTINVKADKTSGVGVYDVVVELGSNANYDVTVVNTTMNVLARPVTVSVNDIADRYYGDTNREFSVSYTFTGADAVVVSVKDALVNGDALTFEYVCEATPATGVGTYPVTLKAVESAVNANYAITWVGNEMTIIQRPVTVTVNDIADRYYGDTNREFSVSYTFTGADAVVVSVKGALVNGDALTFEYDCEANEKSNVGIYDVLLEATDSAVNANYAITWVNGKMTIIQRPVQIVISSDSVSYFYHSEAVEKDADFLNLKHSSIQFMGVSPIATDNTVAEVNGDTLVYSLVCDATTCDRDAAGAIPVGEYDWYVAVDSDAAVNANYAITVSHSATDPVPATVIIEYLPFPFDEQLTFAKEPNEAGWYNLANKATIDAPEDYTISSNQYDDTYGDEVTYPDAGVNEDGTPAGIACFYLERNSDGARTGVQSAKDNYKQDTTLPTISLVTVESTSKIIVTANDEGAVKSGIVSAQLQTCKAGGEWSDYRDIMQLISESGSVEHNEIFKIVAMVGFRVIDEAGNMSFESEEQLFIPDYDYDGLNDVFEAIAGTQWDSDYDQDNLGDYFEEMTGISSRLDPDTDDDGLNDGFENGIGLNPSRLDSDNDGVSDPVYLKYLETLGIDKPNLELGMMFLQSSLLHANGQDVVPAAELVMLDDSFFLLDNGEERAASLSPLVSDTGRAAQLTSSNAEFYMLRFNEEDGRAVYLTAYGSTRWLVVAEHVKNKLELQAAYKLPYAVDDGNLAVATSDDGMIVALAKWNDGATTENILLLDLNSEKQFRFGEAANTVGSTRFVLSADGGELAYVAADGRLYTIDMTEENYTDADYDGNALFYTADGQIVTNVDASNANGVYHVAQPTLQGVSAVLVSNGELFEMNITGRMYFSYGYLYCKVVGLRQSNGVMLYPLYNRLNASN